MIIRGQSTTRPNLLFLMADDHAAYVMGCDGNRQALTPNLDELAAEGVRFAAHHCNSPVCTPSRQSLLTGQMPHSAGVTVLGTPLSTDKPTLAKQLRKVGYRTAVFGKMHFNRAAEPGLHGFDTVWTEDVIDREWRRQVPSTPLPEGTRAKSLPWRPFQTPAREWLNAAKLPYPRRDAEMKGTFIVNQAMRYLEENANTQFALWVSLMEPHSPFDFPLEDAGVMDPARFAVPVVGPRDGGQIPLIFRDLSSPEKQGIAAAYYTSAYFLDRNLGRVLKKLKDLRLDENTLVVYTADHGYDLGQHGRFEKHCGYDPALRVPLILRQPGKIQPAVVKRFTEHLDLGPTLLSHLDAPPLPVQHGQSLYSGRKLIVNEYLENEEVFVRTDRWKMLYGSGRRARTDGYLTDNPTPGRNTRLFDLAADPGEFQDVSAAHPKQVEVLKKAALERFRNTHPDAAQEPSQGGLDELLDFYLVPRDAKPAPLRPA
ncbi:sulfatase family protein [Paludibaculum fermentans]|uniref:sulfatase family protein n=1 Tax=Paludibaculum fermentans TaxID=1473598 RepID=UPI003EB74018